MLSRLNNWAAGTKSEVFVTHMEICVVLWMRRSKPIMARWGAVMLCNCSFTGLVVFCVSSPLKGAGLLTTAQRCSRLLGWTPTNQIDSTSCSPCVHSLNSWWSLGFNLMLLPPAGWVMIFQQVLDWFYRADYLCSCIQLFKGILTS